MKIKYQFIIIALVVLAVFFYWKNTNINLDKSFDLAGGNRKQLEKVLDYYSKPQDSLKRKAAIFLIENMYIHYGFYGKAVEQYNTLFDILDTMNHKQTIPLFSQSKQLIESNIANFKGINYTKNFDCRTITAEYLITNIELSFHAWKNSPWSKNVDFADFCEYILPYRFRNEKLEYWRPNFYVNYTDKAMKYENTKDLSGVFSYMKGYLSDYFKTNNEFGDRYPFHQSINDLSKGRTGSCPDMCTFSTAAMRAAGLPVAMDFVPYWGNLNSSHMMIHLVTQNKSTKRISNENSPTNKDEIFDGSIDYNPTGKVFETSELPKDLYVQYNKTEPKVYRYMYSVQPEMMKLLDVKDKTEIAPKFNILNIKDVSDEYISCVDISINIKKKYLKHQIAYLCVFSINGWIPVALTRINDQGKAVFNKMGKNIIYLPAVYENNEFIPVGQPFDVNSMKKIKLMTPILNKKQTLRLVRKYHFFIYTANHALKLKGGRFEGSNFPDFRKSKLLYEIDYLPFYMNQKIINSNECFRYFRYLPVTGSSGNIAEVEFYGSNKRDTFLLKGTVLGESENAEHNPAKAFDQNMDTYYENNINNGWVGIDLGVNNKQRVTKIRFCPRNDTNCIIPGNSYELFYWNNQWISLGQQIADKAYLNYENVPSGALFWLKCLSGGKEERIFTYENGKQIWW